VAHVALDGFDQVRNQLVAAFELHVDLGERVLEAVSGDYQPVVDAHEPEREQHPDAQEHEQGDDDGTHWPDLSREDCWSRPSLDEWRKNLFMESADKLGTSHRRPSKDGYHINRVPTIVLAALHAFPHEELLSQTGRQPRPEDRPGQYPTADRPDVVRARRR
jgi:hypothetical protein